MKAALWCRNSSDMVPAPLFPRVSAVEVSFSVLRSSRATTAVTAPTTKGMRQPQALNWALVSATWMTTTTSTASSCPPIRVTYWNDEKKPRWPFRATSLM